MNTFDVLTCGSATVDVFAHTDNESRKIRAHGSLIEYMVYPVGAKMIIRTLHQTVGGGGTNTAVGLARLGLHTGYIGCVGNDQNAGLVRQALTEQGISFLGHSVQDATGYSVILDSIAHDRTILTYKGANNALCYDKVHLHGVQTKGVYCSSMMGKGHHSQVRLCSWAKKQGSFIAFNPSLYQTKDGLSKLMPMLRLTDLLIFNKEEAQSLLSCSATGKELIRKLLRFVKGVIITDGPHAVYAGMGNQYYELHPKKVKVIESTGAGDAFASTVFGGLLKNVDFETSLLYGLANSQSVIQYVGAKQGLLSGPEIEKYIKKHKISSCVHYRGTLV